jgi:Ca-activated chloride channel family protein
VISGRTACKLAVACLIGIAVVGGAGAQSGRQSDSERGKEILYIIVEGNGSGEPIPLKRDAFDLYDGGASQTLETLALDQSPARIALLIDNSKSLKASIDELKNAARALVDELFENDRMMVIGFDESAYILQEFTTNLDTLEATADEKLQKKGFPHLFDALAATVTDAFGNIGSEKRVIVLISDGYDSTSKEKFEGVLTTLQRENIVVYVLQAPDRTRNASRIDGPKPQQAIAKLTAGTGGRAFPITDAKTAAKALTQEIRLNWYRAVYTPRGVDRLAERNILLLARDENGPGLRTKATFPAHRSRRE